MSDGVFIALIGVSPLLVAQAVQVILGLRQHETSKKIERSIGPENGETVHELLRRSPRSRIISTPGITT